MRPGVLYTPPVPSKPKGRVVYVSPGTGLSQLSSLAFLEEPVQIGTLEFNSSEHAYMAMRVVREHRRRLAVGGDLGNLSDASIAAAYGLSDGAAIAKKRRFWSGNGQRPEMPGIVARMATKPLAAARLGLQLKKTRPEERRTDEQLCGDLVPILIRTYKSNPRLKQLLLDTGKKTLVEFNPSARINPAGSRWTGMVDTDTGMLHGGNLLGRIHMVVRRMLREEEASKAEAQPQHSTT